MFKIQNIQTSQDGTTKFLITLADGNTVESVLIRFNKKETVCLSTQVGCAMKCTFCYTGVQGFKRHLSGDEIIGQYRLVQDWMKKNTPARLSPKIVFMGQGEPLHNFEALKHAVLEFSKTNPENNLGPREITVSTVGYLPNLLRFDELGMVNLALSLHSPFHDERSKLIPLNQMYPLNEVLAAIKNLKRRRNQFVTIEYLLIKDFNMTSLHAKKLREITLHLPVIFNLIPFNPFPGSVYERPDTSEVEIFKQYCVSEKLRVMVRNTKGMDILAACGQLNTKDQIHVYS
jgi:23S rRNA (adenine2503-C2)-methyltransferase